MENTHHLFHWGIRIIGLHRAAIVQLFLYEINGLVFLMIYVRWYHTTTPACSVISYYHTCNNSQTTTIVHTAGLRCECSKRLNNLEMWNLFLALACPRSRHNFSKCPQVKARKPHFSANINSCKGITWSAVSSAPWVPINVILMKA